jgi:hypothetical protein
MDGIHVSLSTGPQPPCDAANLVLYLLMHLVYVQAKGSMSLI